MQPSSLAMARAVTASRPSRRTKEITASSIFDWFRQEQSKHIIQRLRDAGVNFSATRVVSDRRFAGMTFVLTGTLPTYSRQEASAIIESFGGKTSSSVSKKTTYVLSGEASGSKLDKANALGVEVIDEQRFKEMIK
mgnify:CR=1 FL=1